jgi:hypothetical protein
MFVFGLIVGPVLGLLAGHFLFASRALNARFGLALLGLVLLILLFAGAVDLELRLGLVGGVLLGLLLAFTPSLMPEQDEVQ